ncbi:hypothetical protein TCAL_14238 [Tigriopus californicus]|uniref:Uncharacterized protein n=1 Tax=Tigriopus californicus TaxID=6832 RepID=A0A553NUV0_TIGCA|nr:hypothetical protein TCAL_14238 [Tigriopus californicus]
MKGFVIQIVQVSVALAMSRSKIACDQSKLILSLDQICDGKIDCQDKTDEAFCQESKGLMAFEVEKSNIKPVNITQCSCFIEGFQASKYCFGIPNCRLCKPSSKTNVLAVVNGSCDSILDWDPFNVIKSQFVVTNDILRSLINNGKWKFECNGDERKTLLGIPKADINPELGKLLPSVGFLERDLSYVRNEIECLDSEERMISWKSRSDHDHQVFTMESEDAEEIHLNVSFDASNSPIFDINSPKASLLDLGRFHFLGDLKKVQLLNGDSNITFSRYENPESFSAHIYKTKSVSPIVQVKFANGITLTRKLFTLSPNFEILSRNVSYEAVHTKSTEASEESKRIDAMVDWSKYSSIANCNGLDDCLYKNVTENEPFKYPLNSSQTLCLDLVPNLSQNGTLRLHFKDPEANPDIVVHLNNYKAFTKSNSFEGLILEVDIPELGANIQHTEALIHFALAVSEGGLMWNLYGNTYFDPMNFDIPFERLNMEAIEFVEIEGVSTVSLMHLQDWRRTIK